MRSVAFPVRVAVAVVLLAACGADTTEPRAIETTPSIGNISSLVPGATRSPASTSGGRSPVPGTSTATPSPADPGASPSPLAPGAIEDDVPVEGVITPSCVVRGGTARITITTEPKNAVAFHAVYAGTKGGAPPPFGYGYGGDDRGHANGEGVWTSTWIVRADAPVGPARADVIAADGESFGYDDPGFYVAASSSGCP